MTKAVLTRAAVLFAVLLAGCVSAPEQRPVAFIEGENLSRMGVQAFAADRYTNAAALFNRALIHYQGLNDHPGMFTSRVNLAEVALAIRNYRAAERHLAAAERLARSNGWDDRLRRVRLMQAAAASGQGRYGDANALLEQLLPAGEGRFDTIALNALVRRTVNAMEQGEPGGEGWLVRAAGVLEGRGAEYPLLQARLWRLQARRESDPAAAEALLARALAAYKAGAVRAGTAATLEQWGARLTQSEQYDRAEEKLTAALHVRLWLMDRVSSGEDLGRLADINEHAGRTGRAAELRRWAEAVRGSGPVDWRELQREVLPY